MKSNRNQTLKVLKLIFKWTLLSKNPLLSSGGRTGARFKRAEPLPNRNPPSARINLVPSGSILTVSGSIHSPRAVQEFQRVARYFWIIVCNLQGMTENRFTETRMSMIVQPVLVTYIFLGFSLRKWLWKKMRPWHFHLKGWRCGNSGLAKCGMC